MVTMLRGIKRELQQYVTWRANVFVNASHMLARAPDLVMTNNVERMCCEGFERALKGWVGKLCLQDVFERVLRRCMCNERRRV